MNLFANGAGKQFLTHLLYLSSSLREDWVVNFRTASDPRTAWTWWSRQWAEGDRCHRHSYGDNGREAAKVKSVSSPKCRDGSTPAEYTHSITAFFNVFRLCHWLHVYQDCYFDIQTAGFVQILNTLHSHWHVVSTIGTKTPEVNMYDSM